MWFIEACLSSGFLIALGVLIIELRKNYPQLLSRAVELWIHRLRHRRRRWPPVELPADDGDEPVLAWGLGLRDDVPTAPTSSSWATLGTATEDDVPPPARSGVRLPPPRMPPARPHYLPPRPRPRAADPRARLDSFPLPLVVPVSSLSERQSRPGRLVPPGEYALAPPLPPLDDDFVDTMPRYRETG